MNIKKIATVTTLSFGLVCAGFVAGAQQPARNVNGFNHPNIAAAQRLCDQAFQRITQAQQRNEYDMGGHAAKAKELLQQASNELRAAATAANESGR